MANGHILFTSNGQKLRKIVDISVKGQIFDGPIAKNP